MIRQVIFLLLVCLWPVSSAAGAWLREKERSFTAVSFSANYYLHTTSSTYFEYGLRDNLTLGGDIEFLNFGIGIPIGKASVFIRKPIGGMDRPSKWAYEIGAGAGWVGKQTLPFVRTGLSWGKGFQHKGQNGWMSVDAAVYWDLSYGLHLTKIDGTVGFDFNDQFTGMMQVFVSNIADQTTTTLAPSLIYTPPSGKFRVQIGAFAPLGNEALTSLKLGIWRSF